MTMMRPVTPPQEEPDTPDPLARGSAQRAAIITLILAIVFQPILHPTGPGNSSPVDLLIVAAIAAALVWLAGEGTGAITGAVLPVDGGLAV